MSGNFNSSASDRFLSSALPSGLAMPFTQFAWVKKNATYASTNSLLTVGTATSTDHAFRLQAETGPSFRSITRTTGDMSVVSSAAPSGEWQCVTSRHLNSTNIAIRVDGTADSNTGSRNPSGFNTLYIAGRGNAQGGAEALIAYAGWVNRDITTQEAESLEAGGNPETIFGADLVAYAPMDDSDALLYDPARDISWTNGGSVVYSSDNPTVDAPATTNAIPLMEALYYGATRLDNKTNIQYLVTGGHTGLDGTVLASGTNGSTNASGVFSFPAEETFGAVDDPVTVHLYWEEGSDPAVDRSLIVKTTLVADE